MLFFANTGRPRIPITLSVLIDAHYAFAGGTWLCIPRSSISSSCMPLFTGVGLNGGALGKRSEKRHRTDRRPGQHKHHRSGPRLLFLFRSTTAMGTYVVTPSMCVLGRGGRLLDPAALQVRAIGLVSPMAL